MREKPDWKRVQQALSKYKFAALILCVGVILMALPRSTDPQKVAQTETAQASARGVEDFDLEGLERKLEQQLSQISGVGEASVVLTLRTGPASVLATDVSQGNSLEQETVIVSAGSGVEEPVRVQTLYPTFQGALVVCDGAGSAAVRLEVLRAVSAVTALSSDQISICQRK